LTIERDTPNHANVFGLPFESVPDRDGIYRANQLAQHCRYVMRPNHRSAMIIWDHFGDTFDSVPLQLWHVIEGSPDPAEYWRAKMEDGGVREIAVRDLPVLQR
jgi:hypothetical protein